MEVGVLERMRAGLLEKRRNLADWLGSAPARTKEMRLGPVDPGAVSAHLATIDAALEKGQAGTLGRCTVCGDYVATDLLEMDYTACVCIDHLSPEEIRSLEYELELSQTVQQGLLPQAAPHIPGLEVAAFSRPAQIVGGDYFDFFRFEHGAEGLAIADVAGKGVSASLIMASVQTALRALAPLSRSPAEVLARVNHLFCHDIRFTTFVTLFLAAFDPATRTLTYASAGHNPPLVVHAQERRTEVVAWLAPTGAAIGLIEEAQFATAQVALSPGDVLLLYTDGVTEAINRQREQFGSERLAALVRGEAGRSPRDVVGALRGALHDFSDGQPLADDTTIVALKVAP